MHFQSLCEQHGSTPIVSLKWWMDVRKLNASVSFPATMVPVEPMDESKRWNPPSRMTPSERGLHGPLCQNYLSCICVEWMVKCDVDSRPSTFVTLFRGIQNLSIGYSDPCSRVILGGQNRDYGVRWCSAVHCAMLCLLHPGRGRLICKTNEKVNKNHVWTVLSI